MKRLNRHVLCQITLQNTNYIRKTIIQDPKARQIKISLCCPLSIRMSMKDSRDFVSKTNCPITSISMPILWNLVCIRTSGLKSTQQMGREENAVARRVDIHDYMDKNHVTIFDSDDSVGNKLIPQIKVCEL